MKNFMIKTAKVIPGFLVAVVLAVISRFIEGLIPIHVIGASVIALLLGMLINNFWKPAWLSDGLKFTSKKILKFAIILLGASLSVNVIISVGKISLVVMFFTLLTCFGGGHFIGKALGLNWKISNLISAGTGICGGSAIGLNTRFKDVKKAGFAPMMHGFIISALVVIIAIGVEWCMGLV